MEKPYVISEEIDLLLADNCTNINIKEIEAFRRSLDDDLRAQGKNIEWVNARRISEGLSRRMGKTSVKIVSLDDRYVSGADGYLGVSRGVDENLEDVGYVPRVGYEPIEDQFYKLQDIGTEVVLTDDVLFSGGMVVEIIGELDRRGIKVKGVICGIAIGKGLKAVEETGIDVDAEVVFDEVEDEVCERDFTLVTGSGRRIATIGRNALYFDTNYGRPAEWASINPDNAKEFAMRNYERNQLIMSGQVDGFLGLDEGAAQTVISSRLKQLENE